MGEHEDYIANQGIENTQGLIDKSLLLDDIETDGVVCPYCSYKGTPCDCDCEPKNHCMNCGESLD